MALQGRLQWQCRRGCKELDLLLQHYLDNLYGIADLEEQSLFAELLSYDDDHLLAMLIGGEQPPSAGLLKLVKKITTQH